MDEDLKSSIIITWCIYAYSFDDKRHDSHKKVADSS